jgi:hypothetical protein
LCQQQVQPVLVQPVLVRQRQERLVVLLVQERLVRQERLVPIQDELEQVL